MAKPPRVLIVDDDHELVQGLTVRLRAAGYQVLAAHDGDEALRLAERDRPDVILLDVRMPFTDGFAALAQLHNRPTTKTTPVIVLSACSAERGRVLDLGAHCFLEKPYNSKNLMSAIESSIAGRGGAP